MRAPANLLAALLSVSLVLGLASTARAQANFSVSSTRSNVVQRIDELLGPVILNMTSGTTIGSTISVSYQGVQIANSVTSGIRVTGAGALLGKVSNIQVFGTGAGSQVSFSVESDAVFSGTDSITIDGVRADVSAKVVGTDIVASLSSTPITANTFVNVSVISVATVIAAAPDLVISSGTPTLTPSSVEAGGTVLLSGWTVKNQGTFLSGTFTAQVYLSTDDVITSGEDTLLSHKDNSSLSPGESVDYPPSTLTIPSGTPQGDYYIGIWVSTGQVTESNEANNYAITQLRVVLPGGSQKVEVTINTSPTGPLFIVDGTAYATATIFSWLVGSNHTIATTSPQGSDGTRYQYANWSDGGEISHSVTAPSSATTYTVYFTTNYLLSMTVLPVGGGRIDAKPTSADGYYSSGTTVQLTASANAGYSFAEWRGDLSGFANPQLLTLSAPKSVTANFNEIVPAVTISATDGSASEAGSDPGTFALTRSGTSGPLTVNYKVSGTARPGRDYLALSGSVIFPDGSVLATITVSPIDNGIAEGDRTVIVTLESGASYTVGSPNNATVTIADTDPGSPTINTLNPMSKLEGDPSFTLAVLGDGFTNKAVVLWNRSRRVTRFISRTQLQAAIPTSDILSPATFQVTVMDGNATSVPMSFTVEPNNQPPRLTGVLPPLISTQGGKIRLLGNNFKPRMVSDGTQFLIGGKPVSELRFVNNTQLDALAPPNPEGGADVTMSLSSSSPHALSESPPPNPQAEVLATYKELFSVPDPKPGFKRQQISFVVDTAQFRTNLGINNLDSSEITVDILLANENGELVVPRVPKTVAARGMLQTNDIIHNLTGEPPKSGREGYLLLESNANFEAWASQIVNEPQSNPTNDATFQQSRDVSAASEVVLLASSASAGSFLTSLIIINNSPSAGRVNIRSWDYSGGPHDPLVHDIKANGFLNFEDFYKKVGLTGVFGPIEVEALDGIKITAAARVYTQKGTGGYFEGVSELASKTAWLPFSVENKDFRTNLGITNPGDTPVSVQVRLIDKQGTTRGVRTETVPSRGLDQVNMINTKFGGVLEEGYLLLSAEQPIVGWTTQIDNSTDDPSPVVAKLDSADTHLLIPSTASTNFVSTLVIVNPNSVAAKVRITALSEAGVILKTGDVQIPSKGFLSYSDIRMNLDHSLSNTVGPLEIESNVPVLAVSRVSSPQNHTGGFFQGVPLTP